MRICNWILIFQKIFKLPDFGDDFIRDPVDVASEEQISGYHVIEINGSNDEDSDRDSLSQWMDEERHRHFDPSDAVSISCFDFWEQ
ncbi:MAG: hypothetical protein JXQ81_05450 [Desulfuromonadales bacterium]|nr:hypothetical protein [Desulfuromonadales bacterium]